MKKSIYRLSAGAVILLLLPAIVWLSGWHWQPEGESTLLWLQYLVTETASSPYAALTAIALSLWFVWRLKLRGKNALILLLLFIAVVVGGQGVKSVAKKSFAEARPYAVWLAAEKQLNIDQFYAQPKKERAAEVGALMQGDNRLPEWQVQHWQHEPDHAFPSGHALFVASWALLAMLLLWPRGYYLDTLVITAWALLVEGSRLTLGMHWPQDLAAGIMLSWLLALLFALLYKRFFKLE
ncbi:MAG: phosphatidylglycerophosphatase B [Enterobacteriaceae bacterium]